MKYMRKFFVPILLLLAVSILSGCAFKSVDKRSFVVSIGIDPPEDSDAHFKVTLKIAKPIASLQQATDTTYAYLTEEAKTVSEAIRMLETHNDKVLDFSQTKILAIHEDLFETDIPRTMDYFTRRGDIQLITYVTAAKPSAEAVLKVESELASPGENALYNFFDDTGTESPFITTAFLFEFRRDFKTIGKSALLPLVEATDKKSEFKVNTALIIRDGEAPIKLTPTETKIYNTLMKNASGYGYKTKQDGYTFTLVFDRVDFKLKLHTENKERPRAEITVKVVGAINESNKHLSLDHLDTYNRLVSKEFTGELEKLFKKVQEENTDPFAFGLRYRATRLHTDRTISDWERIYPNLTFDVTVNVKLKSLGAIE